MKAFLTPHCLIKNLFVWLGCIVIILAFLGKNQTQAQELSPQGSSLGVYTNTQIKNLFLFSLKQVQGGQIGLNTNNALGKIKFPFPSSLNGIKGSGLGVSSSQNFDDRDSEYTTLIGKELIFLRELYLALNLNLPDHLNQFVDRETALDNHIYYLSSLANLEEKRINRLTQRIAELQTINKSESDQISSLEKQFFLTFEKFKATETEKNLSEFIDTSQKNVPVKAYLGGLTKVSEYHAKFYPVLINRIKAIKANREALLKGVKVTEIENIDLGLIIK